MTLYTHYAQHLDEDDYKRWTCWDEFEEPWDYLSKYGDHCMGFGVSEEEAIEDFKSKNY